MKTIGLIGGMSWESSLEYYRILNEKVKSELGGLHSAKTILFSVDFEQIKILQHEGNWNELTEIMIDAAQSLEKAGADMIVICTNTMHKMANEVQNSINLPLLHIADATAHSIKDKKLRKVGLLGTKFTMEQEFYKNRLIDKHHIDVVIPNDNDRDIIHKIIYNELCLGNIKDASKKEYIRIINNLIEQGAEGVILGCTEIPLLIKQEDVTIPIFDTTTIHAEMAVLEALKE
ncbi:MAG: aspartate/glutamate racemase family protein [Bacteroidales bacterium]|nr:aspartate/glutamate racemase family protein [Bacteroidales bacterium]